MGVNHTSRKVAWFTYISLLLSVRVCIVCVRVSSVFFFKFSFNTYAISRKYLAAGEVSGGVGPPVLLHRSSVKLARYTFILHLTLSSHYGRGKGVECSPVLSARYPSSF